MKLVGLFCEPCSEAGIVTEMEIKTAWNQSREVRIFVRPCPVCCPEAAP